MEKRTLSLSKSQATVYLAMTRHSVASFCIKEALSDRGEMMYCRFFEYMRSRILEDVAEEVEVEEEVVMDLGGRAEYDDDATALTSHFKSSQYTPKS